MKIANVSAMDGLSEYSPDLRAWAEAAKGPLPDLPKKRKSARRKAIVAIAVAYVAYAPLLLWLMPGLEGHLVAFVVSCVGSFAAAFCGAELCRHYTRAYRALDETIGYYKTREFVEMYGQRFAPVAPEGGTADSNVTQDSKLTQQVQTLTQQHVQTLKTLKSEPTVELQQNVFQQDGKAALLAQMKAAMISMSKKISAQQSTPASTPAITKPVHWDAVVGAMLSSVAMQQYYAAIHSKGTTRLTSEVVADVQAVLGVPKDGIYEDVTHHALNAYILAHGFVPGVSAPEFAMMCLPPARVMTQNVPCCTNSTCNMPRLTPNTDPVSQSNCPMIRARLTSSGSS